MTAVTRLETAPYEAAEALMEVVGLPLNPVDQYGPRRPVSGSLVSLEAVPLPAYRAAAFALDVLMMGIGVMDPDTDSEVSVEDGLAMMTKGDQ